MESNVTMDFDQFAPPPPRLPSYLRLVSVEQLAPKDEDTRVTLAIGWEPVSYRIEGAENLETVRLPLTFRLSDEQIAAYLSEGIAGLPHGGRENRIAVDSRSKDGKERFPFERWRRAFKAAGFPIVVRNGVTTTDGIGHIFECETYMDEFPAGNDETYTKYMIYPRKLADDFVAPAELPVKVREARVFDEASSGEAVSAVTNGAKPAGPSASQLADACVTAGIIGKPVTEFSDSAKQIMACVNAMTTAPILGIAEVQSAAQQGRLVEYLVEKGAAQVEEGVLVRA